MTTGSAPTMSSTTCRARTCHLKCHLKCEMSTQIWDVSSNLRFLLQIWDDMWLKHLSNNNVWTKLSYSETLSRSQMIGLLVNYLLQSYYNLQWQFGYSDTFPMSRGCHCKRGDLYVRFTLRLCLSDWWIEGSVTLNHCVPYSRYLSVHFLKSGRYRQAPLWIWFMHHFMHRLVQKYPAISQPFHS